MARILLQDTEKPGREGWENGLNAMECALCLARTVNQSLLELHKLANEKNDPHLCDVIETRYLHDHIAQDGGAPGSAIAEYLFDKHTLGHSER